MPAMLRDRTVLRLIGVAVVLGLLAGCEKPPVKPVGLQLAPVRYDRLPGWKEDDPRAALVAFLRSCPVLTDEKKAKKNGNDSDLVVTAADWREPCRQAAAEANAPAQQVRAFFEHNFRPYAASGPDGSDGLFTGYFEIELRGSRQKSARYSVPIYRLPADHVKVNLGDFDPQLKGHRIVGRVEAGRLVPYFSRGAIDDGALKGRGLELLWFDDPIDVFMLQVQGSGRVLLPDGSVVRVGYAGHNGLPYESIGRALIQQGELQPGKASWPAVREWIRRNPKKAKSLLALNPRYIFFRFVTGIPPDAGPIGAEGVPLTPGRSLAVDRRYVPLGLPIWLDTTWPAEQRPLRRLVVAQDAGNAIKGVVRGDFFWGYGDEALAYAGKMKSRGRYYLLIPTAAAARLAGS